MRFRPLVLGAITSRQRLVFATQFFEGLPLGLRDAEGRKDTEEHEQSVDLEHVVQPGAAVPVTQGGNGALADDGADLAGGGRDTVRGRSVASGEYLTGDDEGCHVRAEVEEELCQDEDG